MKFHKRCMERAKWVLVNSTIGCTAIQPAHTAGPCKSTSSGVLTIYGLKIFSPSFELTTATFSPWIWSVSPVPRYWCHKQALLKTSYHVSPGHYNPFWSSNLEMVESRSVSSAQRTWNQMNSLPPGSGHAAHARSFSEALTRQTLHSTKNDWLFSKTGLDKKISAVCTEATSLLQEDFEP